MFLNFALSASEIGAIKSGELRKCRRLTTPTSALRLTLVATRKRLPSRVQPSRVPIGQDEGQDDGAESGPYVVHGHGDEGRVGEHGRFLHGGRINDFVVVGVLLPDAFFVVGRHHYALTLQLLLAVVVGHRGFPAKHEEDEAKGHGDVNEDNETESRIGYHGQSSAQVAIRRWRIGLLGYHLVVEVAKWFLRLVVHAYDAIDRSYEGALFEVNEALFRGLGLRRRLSPISPFPSAQRVTAFSSVWPWELSPHDPTRVTHILLYVRAVHSLSIEKALKALAHRVQSKKGPFRTRETFFLSDTFDRTKRNRRRPKRSFLSFDPFE